MSGKMDVQSENRRQIQALFEAYDTIEEYEKSGRSQCHKPGHTGECTEIAHACQGDNIGVCQSYVVCKPRHNENPGQCTKKYSGTCSHCQLPH